MYLVDSLIDLYNMSDKGTTNSILSKYFLLNAKKIDHKKQIDVAKETNISNSSITRFCKSAGYDTFSSFCDVLYKDTYQINYRLHHLLNKKRNFNFNEDVIHKLDQLVNDLKKTSKVIIYGTPKCTCYFDNLIIFLFFKGICVERCLKWRIDEKENVFLDAKDDDVILLINPRYSIQVFLEETESSLGSITSIVKANAQKYFFCENSYDFAGIKAIKLYKSENYGYTLSCIDYVNYILMKLIEGENSEYNRF
ncbi:MAG: hypothetical protein KH215_03255 [Coprobacillus sp.]|nr:hypothetical protein [Coprobacillus sp.]